MLYKCQKDRNKKIHNKQVQAERAKTWYKNKLQEAKQSEYPHSKQFARNIEIDAERAIIKALKNQINIIKEIKKKLEKLP